MLERRIDAAGTCDDIARALASLAALLAIVSPETSLKGALGMHAASKGAGTKGGRRGAGAAPTVPQLPAQAVILRATVCAVQNCLACMRHNLFSGALCGGKNPWIA
jgi:hypothetical protein